MNFDEIKSNWDKEDSGSIKIPKHVSQFKEAKHPIEQIKKNMKLEFWFQVVTIIALPFLTQYHFDAQMQKIFLGFYSVFFLISAYYFYNFYLFYNSTTQYSGDSKDSLYELYYNLRLNMERYKSFGFLLIPFVIGVSAMLWLSKPEHTDFANIPFGDFKVLIMALIAGVIAYIALIVLWVDMVYGKYTRKIKEVLRELKEEN